MATFTKLPIHRWGIYVDEGEARAIAESYRSYHSNVVRVFQRDVKAGGARMPVWAVVVRKRG